MLHHNFIHFADIKKYKIINLDTYCFDVPHPAARNLAALDTGSLCWLFHEPGEGVFFLEEPWFEWWDNSLCKEYVI
jgi:hypothetical protein